jgi:hypothetical protein
LTAILANSNDLKTVADEVQKIRETPNVPSAVMNLLPALTSASTPSQIVETVEEIEKVMGGSGFNFVI